MRTNDLTGNELCFAACMAEMPELVWGKTIGIHEHSRQIIVPELREPWCYSPFINWAMFGPIIEKEMIAIVPSSSPSAWAATQNKDGRRFFSAGKTPLIAAMRCYVSSKLGDNIDIPEDLT